MSGSKSHMVPSSVGDIHVRAYGDPSRPAVLAVHGFSHNGAAFHWLASALSDQYFILCPDMPGRGLSAWAETPEKDYCFNVFEGVIVDILRHFGLAQIRYLGTSMGGCLGMRLAGGVLRQAITHLALNDIGPEIPVGALPSVMKERDLQPRLKSIVEVKNYYTNVYLKLANVALPGAEWLRFAIDHCRRLDDGSFTVHHDPSIYVHFARHPEDFAHWEAFVSMAVDPLILHGTASTILTDDVVKKVCRLRRSTQVKRITGIGHAPFLCTREEIESIQRYFA